MIYSLSINGAAAIDAEANEVELLTREQHNQAVGHVTLMVRRKPAQAPLFRANDKVTIYRDGVPWFTGWSGGVTKACGAEDYGHMHVIEDAWRVCQESVWRGGVIARPTQLALSSSAWYLLTQWQAGVLSPYFTMPAWPASIPESTYDKWPNINGPFSDSIKNLLRHRLLAGVSWDHSTTTPAMRVTNKGDVVRTLVAEADGVQDVSLTRRDDLVPSAVELLGEDPVTFLGQMQDAYALYSDYSENTLYPPGAVRGGWKCATLFSPNVTLEEVSANMAQKVLALLSPLVWEGGFTLSDGVCNSGLYPGMTINLAGPADLYDPEWTGLVIQGVTEDLLKGTTHVTVGKTGNASATVTQRLRDAFRLRQFEYFQMQWYAGGGMPAGLAQSAAGTGAMVQVTSDSALNGTIILTTGGTGFSGADLVKVVYGSAIGSLAPTAAVTAVDAATVALGASVTISNLRYFMLGGGGAVAPNTVYTWTFTVTPA